MKKDLKVIRVFGGAWLWNVDKYNTFINASGDYFLSLRGICNHFKGK